MTNLDFIHHFTPGKIADSRVLLLLHGTGGDESDLLPLGRELDPKAALLSPRGKVLENGAPRFFRRFAEGVFDEEDVVRRAQELAEFFEAAAAHYKFDLSRSVAVGYSNGANIAAALLLLGLTRLRRAILFRAMVPLQPNDTASLSGGRILISQGARDPIVPLENGRRLEALLEAAGCAVEFHLESAGHELTAGDLTAAQRWLGEG